MKLAGLKKVTSLSSGSKKVKSGYGYRLLLVQFLISLNFEFLLEQILDVLQIHHDDLHRLERIIDLKKDK